MNNLDQIIDELQNKTYELNLEIEDNIYVTIRKEEEYESPETSLNISSKEGNIFFLLFTAFPTFNQVENNIKKLESAEIELIYEEMGESEDVRIDQTGERIKIYHNLEQIDDEEILREQLKTAFQLSYVNQMHDRKLLIENLNKNIDKKMSESYYVILDAISQLVEEQANEFKKKYKDKRISEVSSLTDSLRKFGNLSSPDFLNASLKAQLNNHSIKYLAWGIIAKTSQEFSKELGEDAKYLKEHKEHVLSRKAKKLSDLYAEIAKMAVRSSAEMKTFLEKETETYRNLHGIELSTPPIQEILESLLEKTERRN
ncbi:hypothetical protein HY837_03040 [archaeon]|nr:hypothetical protein [archaeon]